MKLVIVNDRNENVANIEVKNNRVVEETLEKCWVRDVETDTEDNTVWTIYLNTPRKLVEELSSDTLIEEVMARVRSKMSE